MKRFVAASAAVSLFLLAGSALAKDHKVEICHWANGVGYFVISVSESAVDKHFANHGDVYPGLYWADADGDGYGDPLGAMDACPNAGFVDNDLDCDDTDPAVNPGAEDVCDGADNDCSGAADESCCADILLHCSLGSDVLETVCGPGPHALTGYVRYNASYIVLGEGVNGAVLTQCGTDAMLSVEETTNFCDLPGGCCGSGRWNDEVCFVELY